jgi:hypothetical protein
LRKFFHYSEVYASDGIVGIMNNELFYQFFGMSTGL